jgi:hypothetical protein
MLYNPASEGSSIEQTLRHVHQADPVLDFDHFITWLETKDSNQAYEWFGDSCVFGLYEQETGKENTHQSRYYYEIDLARPHTFGAALQRARQCQAHQDATACGR